MFLRNLALGIVVGLAALSLSQSAHAVTYTFNAALSGAAENPPNASMGDDRYTIVIFDSLVDPSGQSTINVHVTFNDLLGTTTAAHIHCCVAAPGNAAIAITLAGFPIGVTSGTYDHLFDLTDPASFNPLFVTANGGTAAGAEAALLAGLLAGEAYLNIHTLAYPGGEVRGFLSEVPLPATLPLFATGLGFLGLLGWRRKRKQVAA